VPRNNKVLGQGDRHAGKELGHLGGNPQIAFGGFAGTVGMIVSQHDRGGTVPECLFGNATGIDLGAVDRSLADDGEIDHFATIVKINGDQLFAGFADVVVDEIATQLVHISKVWVAALFVHHIRTTERRDRAWERGGVLTHAGTAEKLLVFRFKNARKRAEALNQPMCQGIDVPSGNGVAEQ